MSSEEEKVRSVLAEEVRSVFVRFASRQLSDGTHAERLVEEDRAEQDEDEQQQIASLESRLAARERAEHSELLANLDLVAGKCALEEQLFAKQRLLSDYARDLAAARAETRDAKKELEAQRTTLQQKDESIRALQQQHKKQHAENEHLNVLLEKQMLAISAPSTSGAKHIQELEFFKRACTKHKAALARQEQQIAALQKQVDSSRKRKAGRSGGSVSGGGGYC